MTKTNKFANGHENILLLHSNTHVRAHRETYKEKGVYILERKGEYSDRTQSLNIEHIEQCICFQRCMILIISLCKQRIHYRNVHLMSNSLTGNTFDYFSSVNACEYMQ